MKTKILTIALVLIFIASLASALTIKDVSSSPSEVAPGESTTVHLKIENELGEDLENVVVGLILGNINSNPMSGVVFDNVPFAPHESSTEKTIEEINDGDEESVSFDLIALSNAEAGIYKIPVSMTYYLDNVTVPVEKISFISLTINAKPELLVSYEGDIIKGMRKDITIRITNAGLTETKFLNVEVGDVSGLRILGNKEVYIGDIESNDFDSVDFNAFVDSDAKSTLKLPVILTYRDATNNLITETVELSLTTYSKDKAIELGIIQKSNRKLYAGIGLVLIIGYIIYRKIKKRRRNNKKRQEA